LCGRWAQLSVAYSHTLELADAQIAPNGPRRTLEPGIFHAGRKVDTVNVSVVDDQPRVFEEQHDAIAATTDAARLRLEKILGRDFARLLLVALAPLQGRRGSSSP
jgi:hypothetical protein